jgi:N-acetylglucosamine kinase-like BadF-type ATPase
VPVPGHLLAVDGGNTSTVALVVDRAGRLAGAARGGCSDIYGAATPELAVAEVVETASAAMARAEVAAADLAVAAFGLAGADWPEDFRLLEEEFAAAIPTHRPPVVVNDAVGALWTGSPDGRGAAAVCGTYLAVAAAGPAGRWHSSFWGEPAGAVPLAELALLAVCRTELGTGPDTRLRPRLLDEAGVDSVEGLLHRFTSRSRPRRPEIARLARAILDTADEGDAVAAQLLRDQAGAVARTVRAAVSRAGLPAPYPLVLAGGLFRHGSPLLGSLLAELLPDSATTVTDVEPAVGVAVMAAAAAGFTQIRLDTLAADIAVGSGLLA